MGQNGSKWPELHWPNPGDPFFSGVRWDGTVFWCALHSGGVSSALHRGGMERELENPGDPFFPSIRSDGTLFQIRAPQGGYGARTRKSVCPVFP